MDQENRNELPSPDSEQQESETRENTAPRQDAPRPQNAQSPSGSSTQNSRQRTGTSASGSRPRNSGGGSGSKDRVRASTAEGERRKNAPQKKIPIDLRPTRSQKPAHQIIPYVLMVFAVFIGVCLLFNLFCNRENILKDNPSAHWMGSVGYHLCYALFGLFGPAVFTLPLLLVNLAFYWRKYIDNRLTISKIVASLLFLLMLSTLIHVLNLSVMPKNEWGFHTADFLRTGAEMTGGGLIGGGTAVFLARILNIPGALIITICLLAASLFYFLGMTPQHLWIRLRMWHKLRVEKRVTVSEQEAEAAEIEIQMNEKIRRSTARQMSVHVAGKDSAAPEGAVQIVEAAPVRRQKDDNLAPMPMPRLRPNEDELYIPSDVDSKINSSGTGSVPKTPASSPATSSASPMPKPNPAQNAAVPPVPVPPRPPVDPAQNRDDAVDPIFPKGNEGRQTRKIPREDRNFDLKQVFIDLDDRDETPQTRSHVPLPPEKPMPGSRPATAPRPAAPVPPKPAPAGSPGSVPARSVAQTAKTAQSPQASPAGTVQKPVFRRVEPSGNRDFGLSSEEFERQEAGKINLPRAGQAPAARPAGSPGSLNPTAPAGASVPGKPVVGKPADTPVKPVPAPAAKPAEPKPYIFPPISYLHPSEPITAENRAEIQESMSKLSETLSSFHVNIREITYSCGPSVTRYEVIPASGVRVRSIVSLSDDIALAFAAQGIRIEAPIPGMSAVGVEVPNKTRCNVYLRELIESKVFTEASSRLTACLGADVTGSPVFFNIEKMPHLLVAGATGMGKSVCINCIIMSLLFKARPDELKLILIDPKKVEFGIYKGIPHLLAPIVTTPKDAAGALQACVEEMERRFELIQQVGVHDIKGYNATTKNDPDMPFMPQIVIIIDELADLMMTAPDEVETAICRLAQKARAAGMHLIIGTQRPSVDVVTGLIKSNIPSRIAFTVASQVDSRTILDYAGAEKLLGRGDMLFAPVGSPKPTRVQGAFVDEKEVEKICEFIRATNGTAQYDENFTGKMKELAAQCGNKGKGSADLSPSGADGDGKVNDPKYADAVKVAIEENRISTSLLQRKLEVGYSRAAKLIDRMESEGIVSKADGSKPRNILITAEDYLSRFIDPHPEEPSENE